MKKTLITLIGALCIVATSATMAVATTTAPGSAARSTVTGALSASSGFAPKCPPAAVVGKALALTLSGSNSTNENGTVECYYRGKGSQPDESEHPMAHLSEREPHFPPTRSSIRRSGLPNP